MSQPFHWFKAVTWKQLAERLNAASDEAILEVHLEGEKMTLEVTEPGQDAVARLAPLNESYLCPPICPH